MTEKEYLLAWVWYISGASIFFAVFWYWTRKFLWAEARQLLRTILAVILIVPWYADASQSYLAPAWLISAADGLLEGSKAFWRAGMPLVLALVLAVLLSTVYAVYRWYATSRQNNTSPSP